MRILQLFTSLVETLSCGRLSRCAVCNKGWEGRGTCEDVRGVAATIDDGIRRAVMTVTEGGRQAEVKIGAGAEVEVMADVEAGAVAGRAAGTGAGTAMITGLAEKEAEALMGKGYLFSSFSAS